MGSSKRDLQRLPPAVVDVFGYALYLAQAGGRHPDAKALSGFGDAGVLEVVESFDGDAFRAVYSARFPEAIVVLHVFQKKSRSGAATPRHDMNLIRDRLRSAARVVEKDRS